MISVRYHKLLNSTRHVAPVWPGPQSHAMPYGVHGFARQRKPYVRLHCWLQNVI